MYRLRDKPTPLPSMLSNRFGSVLTRNFASRTTPLFKKRRGRSKAKALLKKNQDDEDYLSKKIRLLKQQQLDEETESAPNPPKECPRLKRVPFIAKEDLLTDEKVVTEKLSVLHDELLGLRSKLHRSDQTRLDADIQLIMDGLPSSWELFRAAKDIAPQLENPIDRSLVKELMVWWKTSDPLDFFHRFIKVWHTLSEESKAAVLREVGLRLKDSGSTAKERIEDMIVDAIHPVHKSNYLSKVGDIMIRRHVSKTRGRGESMLPTLWSDGCVLLDNLLHPQRDSDILEQVKVGDIVSFIALNREGKTSNLTKRLMGLPGDEMKMIDGKSYVVPKGYFWALGDNPGFSTDSRHFGAIPSQNLRSKTFFAYSRNNLGVRFFTSKYELHLDFSKRENPPKSRFWRNLLHPFFPKW